MFSSVILAAGLGSRLGPVGLDKPKCLLEIGSTTLIERSIGQLKRFGCGDIRVVVGHKGAQVREALQELPGVEVHENLRYRDTGSLASFEVGSRAVTEDVLVLDADVAFDDDALEVILSSKLANAVLVSDFTGAGDEVYVVEENGMLLQLGKSPTLRERAIGEFVGITKISQDLVEKMRLLVVSNGEGAEKMDFEVGLVQLAKNEEINIVHAADLRWGETDTLQQLTRVRELFES